MVKIIQVNVYDFDHTIYNGDASYDFIKYCLFHYFVTWKYIPKMGGAVVLFILGLRSRKYVKQAVFSFLLSLKQVDNIVEKFWQKRSKKIKSWYLDQKMESDIIISASPEFLLSPMIKKLGVSLIATDMSSSTGVISGENCRGEEKARRLRTSRPLIRVNNFYSDSLSDKPLADIAHHAFIVNGRRIVSYSIYRPSKLKMLRSRAFLRFLAVGVINAFLGVLFAFLTSIFLHHNPLLAWIIGYTASLIPSYFLNAVITFHYYNFSLIQFGKFIVSYLPNFVIQLVVVHIFADIIGFYPLVTYIVAVAIAVPITFLFLIAYTFTKKD